MIDPAQLNRQATLANNNLPGVDKSQMDVQSMLQAQYEIQQYSIMVGYESSFMKTIKDIMSGIISKIG